LCLFGTFFSLLVSCTKKNLATLAGSISIFHQRYVTLALLAAL
jgi:hypothetical protein